MASYEPLHESSEWQELSLVHRIGRFALGYGLWAGFVAWGCLTAILIRETYLSFLPVWGPFVMTGVDRVGVILVVMALLGYVLFVEHYLRRAVVTGKLRRRAVRVVIWHLPFTLLIFAATRMIPSLIT